MQRLDKIVVFMIGKIRKGLGRYQKVMEEGYVEEFPSYNYHKGEYEKYENEFEK